LPRQLFSTNSFRNQPSKAVEYTYIHYDEWVEKAMEFLDYV